MKFVLPSVVHICCWLAFPCTWASAQSASSDLMRNARAGQAIAYLKTTQPMEQPEMDFTFAIAKDKNAVKVLFNRQMQAIDSLEGNANASVIPLLIPYLNYPRNLSQDSFIATRRLVANESKEEHPAFDVIMATPGADNALAQYVSNKKYPLNYRLAAFHVLEYVNKPEFNTVANTFQKEVWTADKWAKVAFDRIRKSEPFTGIPTRNFVP